jgi:hypothetical protein
MLVRDSYSANLRASRWLMSLPRIAFRLGNFRKFWDSQYCDKGLVLLGFGEEMNLDFFGSRWDGARAEVCVS